ncbi:hypothetical protein [Sinorhizobium sojae]|uniref:hypothetical protein n=1 Tax=Sinorhizobium sojae TaxID=716925 RepID=UPI0012F8E493|nr:hypothetical protein [Sinorhizobium sojae]
MNAAGLITPIAVIGPRIDLAVDDPVKLVGGRGLPRISPGSDREAMGDESKQDQMLQ